MYYVYILECDDVLLYVGLTTDLDKRISQHQKGQSLHTKRYNNIRLVHSEVFGIRIKAENREKQLKGWSKAKKKALIAGNVALLKELSKSKS